MSNPTNTPGLSPRRAFLAKAAGAVAAAFGADHLLRSDRLGRNAMGADAKTQDIPSKPLREADFYSPHKWAG